MPWLGLFILHFLYTYKICLSNFTFIGIYFIPKLLSWLCLYPILSRYCHKDRYNDGEILIWNFIFPIFWIFSMYFHLKTLSRERESDFHFIFFCSTKINSPFQRSLFTLIVMSQSRFKQIDKICIIGQSNLLKQFKLKSFI